MGPASAGGRSAGGGSAAKSERRRPSAKEAKEAAVKKVRKSRRPPQEGHRQPLPEQLEDPNQYGVRTYGRKKRQRPEAPENAEDEMLPEGVSARIMKEARMQQEEVEAERDPLRGAQSFGAAHAARDSDSDEEAGSDGGFSDGGASEAWDDGEVEVSPEDERALAAFMAPGAAGQAQRSLADIIMDKIRAQQAAKGRPADSEVGAEALVPDGLDPKVVAVYRGVGELLARYTTGKIPKAFKIIPNLRNWEEVLFLTDVPGWSPHAVYQATRLFVSSMNARLAQRFVAIVLLPHVRRDIRNNQRLHFALFQSLKKACYKPDAFYKGFLLPLCSAGDCSLREAVIVSAVLRRVSLPVLHSAAALLRIADMEYSGTNSFFIQVLLNKKYALPYRVVDALVDHFASFADDEREMPVVWHQSLLAFLQRYKHEVRGEDRPVLRELMRKQHHYQVEATSRMSKRQPDLTGFRPPGMTLDARREQVTPEAQRELAAARERGSKPPPEESSAGAAAPAAGGGGSEDTRNLPPVVMMEED